MARPSLRTAFTNLRQPMSLRRKAWLLARNNFLKLRHLDNCCGHPGEPGC